ncbi:M56 family metallopeptidase [Paenibacillus sp. M1]|uniref:M56 family metallopeptidase n=1 Tax=Paenibacillus haidiansis TaxID=1574488 RepID=A0ABU7W0B7_9BACL
MMVWVGSLIWVTGVVYLLIRSVISYLKVRESLRTAVLVKDHIFETDRIATPFVLGFLKPRIYIPLGLSEPELSYILQHEQTHIRRGDYLIKPFAYLMLIVHWFNPLMWLSYSLMNKDMEMSCDERVIRKMGDRIKGGYSTTLLSLSVGRSQLHSGSPLAFGENHVKARIKNILSYRRPSSWRVAGSLLVIGIVIAGCTANPKPLLVPTQPSTQQIYMGYDLDKMMDNKTLYVGAASKVGGLIGGMPYPEGLEGKGMELQTTAPPYGVTINYIMNQPTDLIEDGALDSDLFARNSILLLSMIDNVDSITYSITDSTGQYNGDTYRFTMTREEADKLLGEDVRKYSEDEASVRQLIDRLSGESPTF